MIQDEVIIVIRRRTLEMFSIGDFVINQRAIYPITRHIFQWNLDSVSLSPQRTWPRRSKDRYPVLNILIRFAGILPWVCSSYIPLSTQQILTHTIAGQLAASLHSPS